MVDPQWHFTRQNFEAMGKTVDDALEEMGFPRGWLAVPGEATDERAWRALRSQQPPNQVNDLFLRYIGRRIAGPDEKA